MRTTLTRTTDDRALLRFEQELLHTPEVTWRALTDPAQLSRWYPFLVTHLEHRIGGRIIFDDGAGNSSTGIITELNPPHTLDFREAGAYLHYALRPMHTGCLLTFTHTFTDRTSAANIAAGWHECLDALVMLLDQRPIRWPTNGPQLRHIYAEQFGLVGD